MLRGVRWRWVLLLPQVVRLAARAPRDVPSRWDRYWADVRATGDAGDVLWDSSSSDEITEYVRLLAEHADPALPVVDVGCGNGRYTRAMVGRFPRAVGVDMSPHAVARARAESGDAPGLEFRAGDVTAPGAGAALARELGPCNVFIRGVLHVLDPPARRRLAAEVADLVQERGAVVIAETNYPGPLLGYLESLGAGPRGMPGPVARAIAAGIPRPSRFGDAELDDSFPRARWRRVLADAGARISTVAVPGTGGPASVPGYVAVLRPIGFDPAP